MRFRFRTKSLQLLYTSEANSQKLPTEVVESFFEVMAIISGAKDERDLRVLKGLRLEKLKGRRKSQHSMRLNQQWRLIVVFEKGADGTIVVVLEIVDYH